MISDGVKQNWCLRAGVTEDIELWGRSYEADQWSYVALKLRQTYCLELERTAADLQGKGGIKSAAFLFCLCLKRWKINRIERCKGKGGGGYSPILLVDLQQRDSVLLPQTSCQWCTEQVADGHFWAATAAATTTTTARGSWLGSSSIWTCCGERNQGSVKGGVDQAAVTHTRPYLSSAEPPHPLSQNGWHLSGEHHGWSIGVEWRK